MVEAYRAKKDIAAAGPDPELETLLPGLSGYWSRSPAGNDDDLGGRAIAAPV